MKGDSMNERWLYPLIAAIGFIMFISYMDRAISEPLRLNPTGCQFYAKDANHMALKRDSGMPETATVEYYDSFRYDPSVKPHLLALVHFIYSSSLTPDEAEQALYAECLKNEGWIGKSM